MDIRLSKYNYPFSEPAELNVHYISLDHQLLIKLGIFDAHVQVFRSLPVSRTLEIFDPLSGTTHVHDMNGAGFFAPLILLLLLLAFTLICNLLINFVSHTLKLLSHVCLCVLVVIHVDHGGVYATSRDD